MQYLQVFVHEHRKKAISRQPICLIDYDYDYILEEIDQRDKIEFEREIDVYSDDRRINRIGVNEYYMY